MTLTTQQQQVLNKIKEFIESDASVFILHGYAGTGKTTIIQGNRTKIVYSNSQF